MEPVWLEIRHVCPSRIDAAAGAIRVAQAFAEARFAVLLECGALGEGLAERVRELEAECVAAARGACA